MSVGNGNSRETEPASRTPVVPKPAATAILIRDSKFGPQVLMVLRNKKLEVAAEALVFPGGSVDQDDRDPSLRPPAGDTRKWTDQDVARRVAAIRETFEEAGILLARQIGEKQLVDTVRTKEILALFRQRPAVQAISFGDMIRTEGLELALDLLVPTARWITPMVRPKRFDTYFFLCPAPTDQIAVHDGSEAVEAFWITPRAALKAADDGRYQILVPTRRSLSTLLAVQDVAVAIAAAKVRSVVTMMSSVRFVAGGEVIEVPADDSNAAEEIFVPTMNPT